MKNQRFVQNKPKLRPPPFRSGSKNSDETNSSGSWKNYLILILAIIAVNATFHNYYQSSTSDVVISSTDSVPNPMKIETSIFGTIGSSKSDPDAFAQPPEPDEEPDPLAAEMENSPKSNEIPPLKPVLEVTKKGAKKAKKESRKPAKKETKPKPSNAEYLKNLPPLPVMTLEETAKLIHDEYRASRTMLSTVTTTSSSGFPSRKYLVTYICKYIYPL
jgi:hypothetical protein